MLRPLEPIMKDKQSDELQILCNQRNIRTYKKFQIMLLHFMSCVYVSMYACMYNECMYVYNIHIYIIKAIKRNINLTLKH